MSDEIKELRAVIDSLTASTLLGQIQSEVLLALVKEVAKRTGLTQLDGQPLRDWFQKEKLAQLQRALIQIEDSSPGVAAYLQKQVDDSERRIKEKGGEA
jgi:hypothetical protein